MKVYGTSECAVDLERREILRIVYDVIDEVYGLDGSFRIENDILYSYSPNGHNGAYDIQEKVRRATVTDKEYFRVIAKIAKYKG